MISAAAEQLLLQLLNNERRNPPTRTHRTAGNWNSRDALLRRGLIEYIYVGKKPTYLHLTDKGRVLAENLEDR